MTAPLRPITVSGGPDGIVAECDDLVRTAGLVGSTARATSEAALRLHAVLTRPDILGSALLDPIGASEFTTTLLLALDGPGGLVEVAAECAATDVSLRAAAAAYTAADRLRTDVSPLLASVVTLPRAITELIADEASGQWGSGLNAFVTSDPQLVDLAAGALESVVPPAIAGGAYPDGQPMVTPVPAGPSPPPRNLSGIVAGLAVLDDERADGDIDVTILTGVDASGTPTRRVIVDIPGTGDWDIARLSDPDVTGLGTSLRALAGERTTYEAGVLAAMRAAGVRPSDEVLLVGHSQGGIVAVETARDALASGEFDVTHVVTAGAPIGGVVGPLPRSVQVLALENDGDVVPGTDGTANPDRPNVTTVTIHRNAGSVAANHDLERSYLPGAGDVDASDLPSARSYLAGLQGFLQADSASTQRFLITRTLR